MNLSLKKQLHKLLQTYINDNYFSWVMTQDGSYAKNNLNSGLNKSQINLIETWQNY